MIWIILAWLTGLVVALIFGQWVVAAALGGLAVGFLLCSVWFGLAIAVSLRKT